MDVAAIKQAVAELFRQEKMGDDVDRERASKRVYNLLPKNIKTITLTHEDRKYLLTFEEEGRCYTKEVV